MIADLHQPTASHFEHADLVGRPEAVLHRTQDAEMVAALALEIEHRVHQMLDRLGPRDLALLGDVADEDQRCAARLRVAH